MCFDTQEKVMCELWAMLTSARVYYKEEGVPGKKRLGRFLADFKALHAEVNCDRACCKNLHARNHGMVCAILERTDLREKLMSMEDFGQEACMDIVALLDTTEAPPAVITGDGGVTPSSAVVNDGGMSSHSVLSEGNGVPSAMVVGGADAPPPTSVSMEGEVTLPPCALASSVMSPPLSFGCNLTDEQMVRISCIASTNHLFCVSEGETVDLKPLLCCEECKPMVVPNIRLVAQFFDVLAEYQKVAWDWKNTMDRGGYLVSKNGVPITANTLASALSAIKTHETAKSKKIKKETEKALQMDYGEMPEDI